MQMLLAAGAAFAPIATFAGGHGSTRDHMWIMQESMFGNGGIKPIAIFLSFAALFVAVFLIAKAAGGPEKHPGPPPA